GGHGPIRTWQTLASNIYNRASGGSGILVVGGGKMANDDVTIFWNAIRTGIVQSVTFVNGGNNIAASSFAGFRMIAVVSDSLNTAGGGLTLAEHIALYSRASDIARFVNNGGGLLGFSSQFTNSPATGGPYSYMAGLGSVALGSQ